MTNFLINIKNHYLRVAIAELVDEAMKTYGGSEYQFSQQWNADGMAQANVIFTEMVAGEWYLCHDLFQHAPEQYTLFIFQDNRRRGFTQLSAAGGVYASPRARSAS